MNIVHSQVISSVQQAIDLVCSSVLDGDVCDDSKDDSKKEHRKEAKLLSKSVNIWEQPDPKRGYQFPFGLWFRGEDAQWEKINPSWEGLSPGVFRYRGKRALEEGSLMYHFQLRTPEHRNTHRSEFEWLTLMQHYLMPTRVLDWTENILVALFFAAGGRFPGKTTSYPKEDGRVYILNARRLNSMTSLCPVDRDSIHIPNSIDSVLRANIAFQGRQMRWVERIRHLASTTDIEDVRWLRNELDLFERTAPFRWQAENDPTPPESGRTVSDEDAARGALMRVRLRCPTAIFPHRANPRLVAQQGMFTLHGGRVDTWGGHPPIDAHSPPIPLTLLNAANVESLIDRLHRGTPRSSTEETAIRRWWHDTRERYGPLFISYTIPHACKESILRDLVAVGVHEATMFPELDGQSMYVSEQWWREPLDDV